MLQVVDKEAQFLLLPFSVSIADLDLFVCWERYFRIRIIIGLVLYLLQQTNTCSKSATKTLEIIDDNPKENIFG